MIHIRKIDAENIWQSVKLSVNDNQKDFVFTNAESILEAYAETASGKKAMPYAIYDDDTMIGFIMFGYNFTEGDDFPKISKDNYVLWCFMIDKNFQGNGYGKEALSACLDFIKTMPCGKAKYCWLSYEKENSVAKKLYESFGFRENGEIFEGETVAALKL